VRVSKSGSLKWPQDHRSNGTDGTVRLKSEEAIDICIGTIDSKVNFELYEVNKREDEKKAAATSDGASLPVEGSTMERQTELKTDSGGREGKTAISDAY